MSCIAEAGTAPSASSIEAYVFGCALLTSASCLIYSIGGALTDTLDDLITQNNIDPQLAMKVLANFDRAIAEVLQEKVRSRLTFKVSSAESDQSDPLDPGSFLCDG